MDLRTMIGTLLLIVLIGLLQTSAAMSIPQVDDESSVILPSGSDDGELDEKTRATWLDTRDLDDEFKQMVYLSLLELEKENAIAEGVIQRDTAKTKRGRFQGFCFRRTKSGRYLPYICWKGGRK